jgi:hypothetical protein
MSPRRLVPGLAALLFLLAAAGCKKAREEGREVDVVTRGAEGIRVGEQLDPSVASPGRMGEPSGDLAVGLRRPQFLKTLGRCAERLTNLEGKRWVEVYQPRGEACQERFGRRTFTLVDGVLEKVSQGLQPRPPPSERPPPKT